MPFQSSTQGNSVQRNYINYFPHLPPYSSPVYGILSKLPSSWVPYGELMRIDRPGGLYAFYFPYIFSTLYAACIAPNRPELQSVVCLIGLLLPFNILLRGAACAWNDNVDQSFDRQVERSRLRPVARGAVSTTEAYLFTVCLLAACCPILTLLPVSCMLHTAMIITLFFIYPLMKRVTYYPQVVLGFPFAWAVFFCIAALGMDPFADPDHLASNLALFIANCLWTVVYDTIYAHQDVIDDEKAGVKGMAVRFKSSTKLLSSILALGQITMLAFCGRWAGFGVLYYTGTVGGVSVAMAYFIYSVDLKSPESCSAWFRDQFWTVGAGFMAGLGGEYCMKLITP